MIGGAAGFVFSALVYALCIFGSIFLRFAVAHALSTGTDPALRRTPGNGLRADGVALVRRGDRSLG